MRKFSDKKSILMILMAMCLFIMSACDSVPQGVNTEVSKGDNLRVHFLDVGQADSELIELPNGQVMLIDAGNRADSEFVVDYIKKLNIEKIDYVIATHPHEDHIGGLPEVIKAFEIGKVYMSNKTSNTKIFETLLKEIKNKGLSITEAKSGMNILEDGDLSISIIAPNSSEYEGVNDYSIANKLKYKDISLLFTGDAESQSESEMLNSGVDLSADILKTGHHGSNTSSSAEFLDRVNPKYAVISSETGNSYGHPHKEVIERLNSRNIKILRTDEMSTIVLETDGKNSNLYNGNNQGVVQNNVQSQNEKYIGNKNSQIYHTEDCPKLPNSENRIILDSKKQAEELGYMPHSSCIK